MAKIAPAPIRESITDDLGNVSRPWVQWFTDQFNRINERIEQITGVIAGNIPLADADGSLTDSGYDPTTLPHNVHTHEDGDEGGTLDHGDALTGLAGDDHTQYLLAAGTRNAVKLRIGDGVTNYTEFDTDGSQTMVGDARKWKSRDLDPGIVRLPGANAPAADEIDGFGFQRYDHAVEESVYFHWGVPDDYCEGTANVRGHFRFVVETPPTAPAVSEVVVMGFEWKKISPGDVFSFAAPDGSGTISETIAQDETAWISHVTDDGTLPTTGWKHGDTILFRFYRDATNVLDTYDSAAPGANDAWVWNYHLEYITCNRGTDV